MKLEQFILWNRLVTVHERMGDKYLQAAGYVIPSETFYVIPITTLIVIIILSKEEKSEFKKKKKIVQAITQNYKLTRRNHQKIETAMAATISSGKKNPCSRAAPP